MKNKKGVQMQHNWVMLGEGSFYISIYRFPAGDLFIYFFKHSMGQSTLGILK